MLQYVTNLFNVQIKIQIPGSDVEVVTISTLLNIYSTFERQLASQSR